MTVKKELFGATNDGKEVSLYTLHNVKGIKAQIMDYGAILVNLFIPDKNGKVDDVVLGFDHIEDYFVNGSFFGATIGPSANRIEDARFMIDGQIFQLDRNDGCNNLHSHIEQGFHKKLWDAEITENSVIFSVESPDGEMGFPGNKKVSVTYTLTEENELQIHYYATSDKKTVLNMTNHSYFNLAGHKADKIYNDELWLKASHYTPIVAGAIPTGEIASVIGTPLDFMVAKRIGQDIEADFEQLKLVGGFDHNWVVDDYTGQVQLIARLSNRECGRTMEVYTDLPGVQFYSGNSIDTQIGKEGMTYSKRQALCLETQYFPNSVNETNFIQPIFGAGKEYDSTTIYKFI